MFRISQQMQDMSIARSATVGQIIVCGEPCRKHDNPAKFIGALM